ncbi:MAG TPA: DinB family protein [Chitinophagaceae bacterium]|jgi:uncharacterized damage-inducible protein DinB|nr:DinB family protein [Chitinophagaceae bacterium]
MVKQNLYLIGDTSGFSPQIARLVSMMNYVRHTTLSAIEGLTVNELDYLKDPESNSIGSLLLHIAAAEVGYQAATFEKRELSDEEKHEWGTALSLGERARQEIKGHDLLYYLNKLEQVRTKTLAELANHNDQWLDEQTPFGRDDSVNNYFKWFHVFTHEVNHRGQIRLLRRQAKQSS